MSRRVPLLLAAVALSSCGAQASGSAGPEPAISVAAIGLADRTFAVQMERHHRQTIDLAGIALAPARRASASIVDVALTMLDASSRESATLRDWLAAHRVPPSDADAGDLVYIGGMLSPEEMHDLSERSGASFDQRWLDLMIRHVHGALEIAQTVRVEGSDPEMRALAASVNERSIADLSTLETLLIG